MSATEPETGAVTPEEAKQAVQALTALSEELGLYDELAAADAAAVRDDDIDEPGCPFCGAPVPCASHRPGG